MHFENPNCLRYMGLVMIDGSWSWSWGVILANRIHKLHHTNRVEAIILTDFYVLMLYTHLAKSPTALSLTILFQPTPIIAELVFFSLIEFEYFPVLASIPGVPWNRWLHNTLKIGYCNTALLVSYIRKGKYRPATTTTTVSRLGYPPWILKWAGLESSGRRLNS